MPDAAHLAAFALVCLGMVLTPGPNMAYLVSRTVVQGRVAGLVSLTGVAAGFVVYLLCAAFGITALLVAVPFAYDALRLAGAAYLFFLAWQAVRPGGRSPFDTRPLPPDGAGRLVAMGFLTSVLNPKIVVMYLSLLPQFIDPAAGSWGRCWRGSRCARRPMRGAERPTRPSIFENTMQIRRGTLA